MGQLSKSNKRILITGGTGFLGSNLVKKYVIEGFEITLLKRQTSNMKRLEDYQNKLKIYNIEDVSLADLFLKNKPDIILHCATDYGRKNIDPLGIVEANLVLPLKLLDLGAKNKVQCFINTDTYLDKRINHYSLSKQQFKEWLESYSNEMICINMVLEHFYGAFDDKTKFVSYVIDQLLTNVTEINLTKGDQKRDFVYIDDVVNAFILVTKKALSMKNGFYQYEIGTTQQVKIKELVEAIKLLVGNKTTKINYGAIPYRKNEIMEAHVDITEIEKLGWGPCFSLQEGLVRTITTEKEKIK